MNRKNVIIAIILTFLLTAPIVYALAKNGEDPYQSLQVEIQPRGIKLIFGETQLFQVIAYDGIAPYEVEWFSNGTYLNSGITLDFEFKEPCDYIILSVLVKDSVGAIGTDSVFVYDPLSFSTIIEEGSMVGEASYIIFVDGSTYYSRNGSTGAIDYSGTNASQVVNYSIDDLTSGGLIFFREGTFLFDSSIVMDNYVDLTGTGRASILMASSDNMDRLLDMRACANNRVKDLRIDGDSKVDILVDLTHSGQTYLGSIFEDIYVQKANVTAPSVGLGFKIDKTDDITWINVWVNNCIKAISSTDTNGLFRLYGGSLQGSTATLDTGTGASSYYLFGVPFGGGGGITVRDYARVYLKDCYTEGVNSRNIYGINAPNGRVTINGGFYRTTTASAKNIDSAGTGLGLVTIQNAQFYADVTATYNIDFIGALIIDQSVTYDRGINYAASGRIEVYEAWGTAEASDDDWISFGKTFVGTPQTIDLTVHESDANYFAQVKALNTTHFQLYLYDHDGAGAEAVDKTISWVAEYEP